MAPTFAFEPHKGFGPAILGSPRGHGAGFDWANHDAVAS